MNKMIDLVTSQQGVFRIHIFYRIRIRTDQALLTDMGLIWQGSAGFFFFLILRLGFDRYDCSQDFPDSKVFTLYLGISPTFILGVSRRSGTNHIR